MSAGSGSIAHSTPTRNFKLSWTQALRGIWLLNAAGAGAATTATVELDTVEAIACLYESLGVYPCEIFKDFVTFDTDGLDVWSPHTEGVGATIGAITGWERGFFMHI